MDHPGATGGGGGAPLPGPAVGKMAGYLAEVFRERTGVDVLADPAAWERVQEAARRACEELKHSRAWNVSLPFLVRGSGGPLHLDVLVTQRQFLELVMGEAPEEA